MAATTATPCLLLALALAGCGTQGLQGVQLASLAQSGLAALAIQPPAQAASAGAAAAPEITGFSADPKDAPPGTPVKLQLTAVDAAGKSLQIAWAATSGALSAASGPSVTWSAVGVPGAKAEPGPATLSVLVSNGDKTTSATARLVVDADGTAHLVMGDAKAAAAVAAPQVGVGLVSAVGADATKLAVDPAKAVIDPTKPVADPTKAIDPAHAGLVATGSATLVVPAVAVAAVAPALPANLFEEDFSAGLARWQIATPANTPASSESGSAWAIVDKQDADGGHALALTDPGPLAAAQRTFYLQTLQAIDLSSADQPRLRLVVKNGEAANASFKVVWQSADARHPEETLVGTRFDAANQGWTTKDFDLSLLAGRSGRLVVSARADAGAVPMIHEVSVYDAAPVAPAVVASNITK